MEALEPISSASMPPCHLMLGLAPYTVTCIGPEVPETGPRRPYIIANLQTDDTLYISYQCIVILYRCLWLYIPIHHALGLACNYEVKYSQSQFYRVLYLYLAWRSPFCFILS